MDLDCYAGRAGFVVWWLEHGRRLHPGLAPEINASLRRGLHSFDYKAPLSHSAITPLMRIVYGLRSDLQAQYPDLEEEISALGFWQWWCGFGSSALGLELRGFPTPSEPLGALDSGVALKTIKFFRDVIGDNLPAPSVAQQDDRVIFWWFQVGQSMFSPQSARLTEALLETLHTLDSAPPVLRVHDFTRLMRSVYASRADLQSQYPDLSEEPAARGYWLWWCLYGCKALQLPDSGLPLGVSGREFVFADRPSDLIKFLMKITGEENELHLDESKPGSLVYWWIARGRTIFDGVSQRVTASVVTAHHQCGFCDYLQGVVPEASSLMQAVLTHRPDVNELFSEDSAKADFWRWWLGYAERDYNLAHRGMPVLPASMLTAVIERPLGSECLPLNPLALFLHFMDTRDARSLAYFAGDAVSGDLGQDVANWLECGGMRSFAAIAHLVLAPLFAACFRFAYAHATEPRYGSGHIMALVEMGEVVSPQEAARQALRGIRVLAQLVGAKGIVSAADALDWWQREGALTFPECSSALAGILYCSAVAVHQAKHAEALANTQALSQSNAGIADVQVIGYPSGQFGIGEDARLVFEAARSVYGHVRLFQSKREIGAKAIDYAGIERIESIGPSLCKVFCMPAFDTIALCHDAGRYPFDGGYRVGIWQWELARFPDKARFAFDLVDEIWTISSFCQKALSVATDKPVHVLPLPVKAYPDDGQSRDAFGIPANAWVFMTAFDGSSFIARKNPLAVIEAFQRAFKRDDPAVLVVKAMNTTNDALWRECLNRAASDERLLIIDEVFSPARLSSLLEASDCIVSLHRAEGFGRLMADAFAHHKPVIASRYSGCMDFLTDENAYLVDGKLIDISPLDYPFYKTGKWFNPDIDNAAEKMRWVFEKRDDAAKKGANGFELISDRYSVGATSLFIKNRLSQIIGN
ncbi:glycosyltransferase family 4 protein [Uliginosibacterium sp. 31-12]|uniref:glycosyltransferase family 4 protein n=1 Tax=Uliginosibacterium sp. 31-12 TaxID=3062781 RepID=UPI0026E18AE7|nr:glycosyltransferase family 4 protein [Uliginosibacterium sp. 31-12]